MKKPILVIKTNNLHLLKKEEIAEIEDSFRNKLMDEYHVILLDKRSDAYVVSRKEEEIKTSFSSVDFRDLDPNS